MSNSNRDDLTMTELTSDGDTSSLNRLIPNEGVTV